MDGAGEEPRGHRFKLRDRQSDRRSVARAPLLWAVVVSLLMHGVLMTQLRWRVPTEEAPISFHAQFLRRARIDPDRSKQNPTERVERTERAKKSSKSRLTAQAGAENAPVPPPVREARNVLHSVPRAEDASQTSSDEDQAPDKVSAPAHMTTEQERAAEQAQNAAADASSLLPAPQAEADKRKSKDDREAAQSASATEGKAADRAQERSTGRGPEIGAKAITRWPQNGRIGYRVLYGDSQVWAGEAEQTWRHSAHDYEIRLDLRSIGFARLIRAFDLTWLAHGRLIDGQMVSDDFRDERNKKVCESKVDLARGVIVQIRRGEKREISIDGAALDVLSMIHFASMQFESDGEGFGIFIDGGCWVSAAQVAMLAEETIGLPIGELQARHYRSVQNDGTMVVDFWMAKKWHGAPVRIRIDDRKQKHMFDLQAAEVTLEGKTLARAPRQQR